MDEQDESKLKEMLLNIWNNNAIFRDNIAILTQVSLRNLPAQIIHDALDYVEDMWRYEFLNESPPPLFRFAHPEHSKYAGFAA